MTKRAEKKRSLLLKAARSVVRDGGFRELQMNTVAAAAGVAVGTIYRYFPSKAQLCAELVGSVSERELSVMQEIAKDEGPAPVRLQAAVRSFAARAFKSGRLAYAMIAEPVDPEVEDVRLRYRAEISTVFKQLLSEGRAEESLQVLDLDTASTCITGAFMEGVIGPLSPGEEASAAEIERAVEQIAVFCLRAVAAPPPIQATPPDATDRSEIAS